MKIKYFSSLIFILILLTTVSFGQGLKFGFGGGISTISNSNSGLSYNAGYHLSAKAKLDIPLFPIKPIVFIQYYILNGSYSFANFTGSTTQKIFSAGIGAEYSLLPGPISPYLALDIGFNNIGEVKYDPAILNQFSYPAISRTGLDIGAGVEIAIPFFITFDVNAKYNMLNLFGKQGGEGSISVFNLNLTVLF
jgi:Outer membrane protein beta-barrel domain